MNSSIRHDDNTELMLKARRGDHNAFAQLYRRLFPVMRSFLASLNGRSRRPDNLTQEVFVRAWEYRKRFQARSSCSTYLGGIARNVLREENRRLQKERIIGKDRDSSLIQPASKDPSPLESAIQRDEFARLLAQAKERLSAKQLQAFELVHILDMPVVDAARLADCSRTAFANRLYRARKLLRRLLTHML